MIFLQLFLTFFKIGAFTFGGGYAMLPLIREEVIAHGWLTEQEIVNFIAVSESTPGSFSINMSTYVGMKTGGILGAVCATLGVVLPSFIIILIVARLYDSFKMNKIVSGCMSGLKPAVIGLIATAVISVGRTALFPDGFIASQLIQLPFLLAAALFAVTIVLAFKKVHPIIIILLSAAVGITVGFLCGF